MKLKKIIPVFVDFAGLSLKIAWRLFWLLVGVYLLWKGYIQIQNFLDMDSIYVSGAKIYEGDRSGALPELAFLLLISIVISLYAFFYAITGRLLWAGIFVWLLIAIGVGLWVEAGKLLYTAESFDDLLGCYYCCCLAFLLSTFSVSKIRWLEYQQQQAWTAASGAMTLSGIGLLFYAMGTLLLTERMTNYNIGWIFPLPFLSLIFLRVFVNCYEDLSRRSSLIAHPCGPIPIDNLCSGDCICIGAWPDYLDDLEENALSACLDRMGEETNLSADKLQCLRAYARSPGMIKSIRADYAEIIFYALKPIRATSTPSTDAAPISAEEYADNMQCFTVNKQALSLLFQLLPLFVITREGITVHRTTKQALLYAGDIKATGSYAKIYDALGHEYQPNTDSGTHDQAFSSLVPTYPAKKQVLANALQAYLAEQNVILPLDPDLSSLVCMAIGRLNYTKV